MRPSVQIMLVLVASALTWAWAAENALPDVDRMMGVTGAFQAAPHAYPSARRLVSAGRREGDMRDGLGSARYALWLRGELRSPDWEKRREVVLKAGRFGRVEAVSSLGAALLAPAEDPRVRAAAAAGLGGIGYPQGAPYLRQALTRDASWQVRVEAARALGAIGDRPSAPVLAQALRDPEAAVRVAAGTALGRVGGPEAIKSLHEALRDETDPLQAGVLAEAMKTVRP